MAAVLRKHAIWRRLIGGFAAYSLVIHLAFAGPATGHFFAPAGDAGHHTVLCLNDPDGQPSPAESPAHPLHGKIHCLLCAVVGGLMLSSVEISLALERRLLSALVPASERASAPSRNRSPKQSRAPPLAA